MKKMLVPFVLLALFSGLPAASAKIRVLILDDLFQSVPAKDASLGRVGKLRGDLLVNGTHYPGKIEVWRDAAAMYLINELPLEDYVGSVVSAEVGPNWDVEALKAQAVIARTYVLYQKNANSAQKYDVTSSVLHQVYKGSVEDARVSYAVMQTEGEVLTYDGKLIEAFYHSTCGGRTEDSEEVFGKKYPYLRPVESTCDISPYSTWERKIPVDELERALDLRDIRKIKILSYTKTKRVRTLAVVHKTGTLTVKATDLRKLLGWTRLPSTNFKLTRDKADFVFEGKGYGHGVGLCQWGALELAREGKNYRDILAFFYPGTTIELHEDR